MATLDDIDTKSAVRKFLERRVVVDREDQSVDSADEVQAVLESVAVSFLLHPQAVLSFVLRAKNILQQVVAADLSLLDYLLRAVGDVSNPTDIVTDTSDLVEAQSALVEVDRLGRIGSEVRAYDRYTSAIERFLDRRLAKPLKRHRRIEFERAGSEAKQDIFRVLGVYSQIHSEMAGLLSLLSDSVAGFESIDLTKLVSTRTVTRVRSSLQRTVQGIQSQSVSNTSIAVELLAGAAALKSISNLKGVYDPTVKTGSFPSGRSISAFSATAKARAEGPSSVADLSAIGAPWIFEITADPELPSFQDYNIYLPASGVENRPWVKSSKTADSSGNITITASNKTLYVLIDGLPGSPITKTIVLTPGVQSFSSIVSAIDTGLGGDAFCIEAPPSGSKRFLIYGDSGTTRLVILSTIPGTFDGVGVYSDANGSVGTTLGFEDDQESRGPSEFSPEDLLDIISEHVDGRVSLSIVDGVLVFESDSEDLQSSLSFGGAAIEFGLSENVYRASPEYLELRENGVHVNPSSLGVFVGSVVSVSDVDPLAERSMSDAPIDDIQDTKIFFESGVLIARCSDSEITILSPVVSSVRLLLDGLGKYVEGFEEDNSLLQRAMAPLISQPTLAQINDATEVLNNIRIEVSSLLALLSQTVVREDRTEFYVVASQIVAALEERGLDRALDLLRSCDFRSFFSLTKESASKSSRMMKSVEEVGRNDLPDDHLERDLDETNPRGTTPDDGILEGEELIDGDPI